MVFLDSSLFATFNYNPPPPPKSTPKQVDPGDEDEPLTGIPPFEISMVALLEILQLFGLTESSSKYPSPGDHGSTAIGAFDPRMVGLTCVCRLAYSHIGGPLIVVLSEGNISTTASLTAYEPMAINEIPFDRQSLALKVIMKSSALFDAITELSTTNPSRLTIMAAPQSQRLSLIAASETGSTIVDFSADLVAPSQKRTKNSGAAAVTSSILETFLVPSSHKVMYDYKFGLVKRATRAMSMATKLSLRIDDQGVMNMQFMVELEDTTSLSTGAPGAPGTASAGTSGLPGRVAFVDFRFVPFIRDGDDDDDDYTGTYQPSDGDQDDLAFDFDFGEITHGGSSASATAKDRPEHPAGPTTGAAGLDSDDEL